MINWEHIKDILLIVGPICVAFISYLTNKKSKKELLRELDIRLKEKDNETANEIKKMGVELESKMQLSSWNNSMNVTSEYSKMIGTKRYANISSLKQLAVQIDTIINSRTLSANELKELLKMSEKIELPKNGEELYPFEVPILFDFSCLIKNIKQRIKEQGGDENATNER